MENVFITEEIRNNLIEELKDNFFAKKNPDAFQEAIEVLHKVKYRNELRPYMKVSLKEKLDFWNILAASSRFLLRLEAIDFEVDEIIDIHSNIYKTKRERAKILEINKEKYMILVRPLRDHAEVKWLSTDICIKIEEDKGETSDFSM